MGATRAVGLVAASLLVLGCGGGGGGTDGSPDAGAGGAPSALVQGTVVSRDGSVSDLAGLLVACLETGDVTTTDLSGAFDIAAPVGVSFSIEVTDPRVPTSDDGRACAEPWDDSADGTDLAGPALRFEAPLDDGETCTVELAVAGGEVVQAWIGGDGTTPAEGSGLLFGDSGVGEIEVSDGSLCASIEVEVEGFQDGDLLTATLVSPAGEVEVLGSVEVAADGAGHLSIHACLGLDLPFGASDLADLAGYRVEVRDETGAVVLSGDLPFAGAGHEDDWWMSFEDAWFGFHDWMDLIDDVLDPGAWASPPAADGD